MKTIKKVIDHQPQPIDTIKGGWYLWDVRVQYDDGTEEEGSMQGDGYDLWAFESFEPAFYPDFS